MEAFIDNLKGSTNTVEFIKFFEHYSKNLDISHSTLKKHKSIFEKLRNYSPYITFPDIDPAFFEKYRKSSVVNKTNRKVDKKATNNIFDWYFKNATCRNGIILCGMI